MTVKVQRNTLPFARRARKGSVLFDFNFRIFDNNGHLNSLYARHSGAYSHASDWKISSADIIGLDGVLADRSARLEGEQHVP